jgi:hypothetical protein
MAAMAALVAPTETMFCLLLHNPDARNGIM